MAMNFPDAPVTGDIYGPYQWDGEKWVTTGSGDSGGGGGEVTGDYLPLAGGTMTGSVGFPRSTVDVSFTEIYFGADPSTGLKGSENALYLIFGGVEKYSFDQTGLDVRATGGITLYADPINELQATNKKYVDAQIAAIAGGGGGEGGAYLPLTGGTMTGDIIMTNWDSQIVLMPGGNQTNTSMHFGEKSTGIWGTTTRISIGAEAIELLRAESTGVTAFRPIILTQQPTDQYHAANKKYVDEAIALGGGGGGEGGAYLPLAGGILTGDLTIATASPTLTLDRADATTNNIIEAKRAGVTEWRVVLGDNINYDFYIEKFGSNGAGVSDGKILHIEASAGWVTLSTVLQAQAGIQTTNLTVSEGVWLARDPTQPLEAATKQYVDGIAMAGGSFVDAPVDGQQYARQDAAWTVVAGGGGGEGGAYLPLTGGTLTGDLSATGYLLGINKFATVDTAANRVTVWGTNTLKETLRLGVSANEYFADSHSFKGSDGMSTIFIASKTSGVALYKPLLLQADPQQPLHAATKQYVDAQVAAGGGGGATGDYLPLSGGEITGDLAISKIDPVLVLERPDTLSSAQIVSKVSGVDYWTMTLGIIGDNDFSLYRSFSGSTNPAFSIEHDTGIFNIYSRLEARADINTPNLTVMFDATLGRDPTLPLHAATKQYVDAVAGGGGGATGDYLPLTGGAITGDLSVSGQLSSPTVYAKTLIVDGPNDMSAGGWIALDRWQDGLTAQIIGKKSGVLRWDITLGNADPDGFPNDNWEGSNFEIASYDNFGRNRDINFTIDRYTGESRVGRDPITTLGIATKNYVDIHVGMVHVGETKPVVQENVLWWDNVEGQLYIQVYDIDYTYQWVQAVPDPYYMLKTTGGSMTGALLLAADPAQPLEAATKQYVDAALTPLADLEARIRKLEQA